MKFVVTGGGTGGHIYPALAVAEQLRLDMQVTEVVYIGNQSSLEATIVPEANFPFRSINFYGMPRGNPILLLQWSFALIGAVKDAMDLLKEIKPAGVFGTGGYVSAPVLIAAKLLGIPYMVHEPDALPGLVNRTLSRWAYQSSAGFRAAEEHLKAPRFHYTGNPLRGHMGAIEREEAINKLGLLVWRDDKPALFVGGGSQGARTINNAIIEIIPTLIDEWGIKVIHQTGQKLYDECLSKLQPKYHAHERYVIRPYFNTMPEVMAVADLAVCRAGALTLSELSISGVPAILVPYPHAAADHQRKNAEAYQNARAAIMLEDHLCMPARLKDELETILFKEPQRLQSMTKAAEDLACRGAAEKIIHDLKEMCFTR